MSKKQYDHPARAAYEKEISRKGYRMGASIDALYDKGGNELLRWLAAQTPDGATVCDTLAAIALDAMQEEQD